MIAIRFFVTLIVSIDLDKLRFRSDIAEIIAGWELGGFVVALPSSLKKQAVRHSHPRHKRVLDGQYPTSSRPGLIL